MLLGRGDLPVLAEVARSMPTLLPTQRSLLKEIVDQVYLAGQHGYSGAGAGYVGVTLSPVLDVDHEAGARVMSRLPGYDAIRALELDDLITAAGRVTPESSTLQAVNTVDTLREVLGPTKPGDWIQVQLERSGVSRNVYVRVGPLPPPESRGPNPEAAQDWMNARHALADRYWKKTFLPKLDEGRSTKRSTTARTSSTAPATLPAT